MQEDDTSNAGNSHHVARDGAAAGEDSQSTRLGPNTQKSSNLSKKSMETNETAEKNMNGLKNAQNILKKSDEVDPLNDIDMDSHLPATRATVGTKRNISAVASENIDMNVQTRSTSVLASSKPQGKSLGGPRPGAQKVSPADSDDETEDIEDSEDDTIRNLSSAMSMAKPLKKQFPTKLVHPSEEGRKKTAGATVETGGRRRWSLEEEEALIKGYARYRNHKDIWSKIMSDPDFNEILRYRDNVALKDKWRNLSKK